MHRWRLECLVIAAATGVAVALWLALQASLGWVSGAAWMTSVGGGVVVGLLVGVVHHVWMRRNRIRWHELRDRQNRLNGCQQVLAYKVKLLELERQRLETIFNALGDAVLVTAADDTVELVNDAATRLLGLPKPGGRPGPVDKLIDDPRLLQLIREARDDAHGPVYRHLEYRAEIEGEAMIFDLTLAGLERRGGPPAPNERGRCDVVAVLRDVTRQRCVAEMHSDFVSSVSHELRTPLSSIKAYMEMLVDGEARDEPTRQEFYAIIQAETDRLTRLIDNVLNISQIESGLANVQPAPVNLHGLINEAIELTRTQAHAGAVTLQGPAADASCEVIADADMLLQVLLNLLGNAVKYTPPGGCVSVTLRVPARTGMVEVAVQDTGWGIPEADVPFIFDKFYRVDAHRQLVKGTGLGLNLVKHVVETVHGGELSVASRPDVGSTFTFRLSMAEKGDNRSEASLEQGRSSLLPATPKTNPCFSGSTAGKEQK